MMRLGGSGGMGGPPQRDPDRDRQLANAAVIGNGLTFLVISAAFHFAPLLLEPMGFEVYV